MHAHIAVATTADRAQYGRGPAARFAVALVLWVDLIALVLPASQAAYVGPLAVVVLQLRLRRAFILVAFVVILLGQAEVHEGAVP